MIGFDLLVFVGNSTVLTDCNDDADWMRHILTAYAEHGMREEAQATFERMTAAGVQPNEATFTVLLSLSLPCNLSR